MQAVELSKIAIPYAQDNLQQFPLSEVHEVDFADYDPKEVADLTMFVDVLEHVEDPASVLRKAASMTRFGIVRSPLEESVAVGIHERLYGEDIQGLMEQRYGHINHFTKRGLKELIEANGFDVTYISTSSAQGSGQSAHNSRHIGILTA